MVQWLLKYGHLKHMDINLGLPENIYQKYFSPHPELYDAPARYYTHYSLFFIFILGFF